jgi:hypothetical protein
MTDYEFIMSLAEVELGSEFDFRHKTGHRLMSIANQLVAKEQRYIKTSTEGNNEQSNNETTP